MQEASSASNFGAPRDYDRQRSLELLCLRGSRHSLICHALLWLPESVEMTEAMFIAAIVL